MSAPADAELAQLRAEAQSAYRDLRNRIPELTSDSIDLILSNARSHYAWKDQAVSDEQLQRIYEITAQGATSMNTCPARFVFVKTDAGK